MLRRTSRRRVSGRWLVALLPDPARDWWSPLVAGVAIALVAVLVLIRPGQGGALVVVGGVGAIMVLVGLGYPVVAVLLLLITQFLRLPLSGILPLDPFLLAFVGVVAAVTLASMRRAGGPAARPRVLVRPAAVELVMVLYVVWNIGSSIAAHPYPAIVPDTGEAVSVWRFILTGTVIPFVLFVVGRRVLGDARGVRVLMWMLLGLTAYSAAVSHLQLYGPTSLVWPREILQTEWTGRAVGIFNQPVVNGLVLIVGFVAAMFLAAQDGRRPPRIVAAAVGGAAVYGIYLTHTRAAWLAFLMVVVLGALFAKRFRAGFLITLVSTCLVAATNWSVLTSSDRAAGGVASAGEVEDRLNIMATSLWAIEQRPLFGWGVARFVAVNTYHHKQWSWDITWNRGYGLASHFNELGIAAELGVVGLGLWLAVLGLMAWGLWRAFRSVRGPGLAGSGLVFIGASSFFALLVTGVTVDLRFFDFPNSLAMLLAGLAVGAGDRAVRTRPVPVPAPRRVEVLM